jgi:hypothetical protein
MESCRLTGEVNVLLASVEGSWCWEGKPEDSEARSRLEKSCSGAEVDLLLASAETAYEDVRCSRVDAVGECRYFNGYETVTWVTYSPTWSAVVIIQGEYDSTEDARKSCQDVGGSFTAL